MKQRRKIEIWIGTFFLFFSLSLVSCQLKDKERKVVEYSNGRQMLTVNHLTGTGQPLEPPKIEHLSPDSIVSGEEFVARIFLERSEVRIVKAFVDCDSVGLLQSVDTTTLDVTGCSKKLLVENDTILVGFRSKNIGHYSFPKITILTQDKVGVFRTLQYSFDYTVYSE